MVECIKNNQALFVQGSSTDMASPYSASKGTSKTIASLKIEISKWAKLQGVAK